MEKPVDNKFERRPAFASELWFTSSNEVNVNALRSCMEHGGLIATVRLGDRSPLTEDPKGGYEEGRIVRIRIRKEDGPFEQQEASAVIQSVRRKKIGELSVEDLKHGLPGERDKESLRSALENFYRKKLTDDDVVTILEISFLGENAQS